MSAPTGNWTINANGFSGTMSTNVDVSGNVTGTMLGNTMVGFWDETSQRLIVYCEVLGTNLSGIQIYTGYRYGNNLAGSFEAFAGSGANASRSVYGWHATQP